MNGYSSTGETENYALRPLPPSDSPCSGTSRILRTSSGRRIPTCSSFPADTVAPAVKGVEEVPLPEQLEQPDRISKIAVDEEVARPPSAGPARDLKGARFSGGASKVPPKPFRELPEEERTATEKLKKLERKKAVGDGRPLPRRRLASL